MLHDLVTSSLLLDCWNVPPHKGGACHRTWLECNKSLKVEIFVETQLTIYNNNITLNLGTWTL